MPALVLYGVRTFVAGDDLRFFFSSSSLLRLLQVALIGPLFVWVVIRQTHKELQVDNTCSENGPDIPRLAQRGFGVMYIYIVLGIINVVVGLAIDIALWKVSGMGTPTEPHKRSQLKNLCQVKLILHSMLRLSAATFGILSLVVVDYYCDCGIPVVDITDPTAGETPNEKCEQYQGWIVVLKILVFSHVIEAGIVILMGAYFTCKWLPPEPIVPLRMSSETKWRLFCRCCCTCSSLITCFIFGGLERNGGDFSDIALILADFFDGDGTLDVVTSDIVTGLVMLLRVQEQRRLECRETLRENTYHILHQQEDNDVYSRVQPTNEGEGEETCLSAEIKHEEAGAWEGPDEEAGIMRGSVVASSIANASGIPPVDADVTRLALLEMHDDHNYEMDETEERALHALGPSNLSVSKSLIYRLQRREDRVYFQPEARPVLSPKKEFDKFVIAEGARFMRLSLAIYTWIMYTKTHKSTGFCVLCGSTLRNILHCSCTKSKEMVIGDNVCGWHEAALHTVAGFEDADVAYARFHEGYARTPYCIVIDHAWKSIVLVIRGTESLDDLIADLSIRPVSLEEMGQRCGFDGQDEYVHAGMLACSEWIYNDLESHGTLDKLLFGEDAKFSNYTLRITGHSLGAGCAAILSRLLRNRFPDLRCLCFSPPGCTVSANMAEDCKEYLISYVLDLDIIPRASLQSFENLRNDMLEMIVRLKVPKYEALHTRAKGQHSDIAESNRRLLHRAESVPPSKFRVQLDEFHARQDERKRVRDIADVPLYPPGKILHLVKTFDETQVFMGGTMQFMTCGMRGTGTDALYTARWAEACDFDEVVISSHFLEDHEPANVLRELERTAEHFGLSPPYLLGEGESHKSKDA